MTLLIETFTSVLHQSALKPSRLIVAFSGGVDSRVLLELAAHYSQTHDIECSAVHVHHGLSENADHWVEQCQAWCDALSVSLAVERVSLDINSGESVEKLARDARYQAFQQHIRQGDVLVTGQHIDDQLETFLLALKRGSGPKGLSSMAKVMSFGEAFIVRPLLSVTRADIEESARDMGLTWVEDESNQDLRFDRNFIRHQVTPTLTERWPSFRESVSRSAQLCAEQELLLDELLESHFLQALGGSNSKSLSIEALSQHSDLLRARLIRMWISHCNQPMPSQKQLKLIWDEVACSQADANPKLVLNDVEIRRFNNQLYLVQDTKDLSNWVSEILIDENLLLPDGLGEIHLNSLPSDSVTRNCDSQSFSLPDTSATLRVIFNPEGLSAHPVGRGHSRKLKKLFQEYQVPSWLRRRTPILMDSDRVIAVLGLFVDKNYEGQDCEALWSK
ncbi:tRNA lysidine(34) synthetase TilS [Vibrio splendidus]|uniref:tRNA(Ile)-lysidine synthase n=1 Tax=Vibrio lentus TaxID=136468 RepID=A0A4U2F130_9VIBR|nr:tRNA lysidine(34) synthetase TilS [Vibrio lentus]PHN86981.1 tRNA lysidine(34) synthetase TilS [Vibrio splendidus]MCC4782663.1 tRNA lysidine(34) synthetase TilS [Vibrio lentus]MCC4855450.1 tRNA lysidine(34) synthetase TilS [Vibrio lentus]PME66733.1 tRNA lysidine(34) synthetase TilS [Vibrio lentus]PMG58780.1 tRNA lysidine(34) synthetase TilS [Vibrio lentus]